MSWSTMTRRECLRWQLRHWDWNCPHDKHVDVLDYVVLILGVVGLLWAYLR